MRRPRRVVQLDAETGGQQALSVGDALVQERIAVRGHDERRRKTGDIGRPTGGRIGQILPGTSPKVLLPHRSAHLAAAYPREPWVEHFDWLTPLFDERLDIRDGRIHLSARPGLGLTISDQARAWTRERATIGGDRRTG